MKLTKAAQQLVNQLEAKGYRAEITEGERERNTPWSTTTQKIKKINIFEISTGDRVWWSSEARSSDMVNSLTLALDELPDLNKAPLPEVVETDNSKIDTVADFFALFNA